MKEPTVAELFIKSGLNLNNADAFGNTPLCAAILGGHESTGTLLIHGGANVDTTDAQGYTPLYLALRSGNTSIANLVIDRGIDLDTPLYVALKSGYTSIANLLIERGADIHTSDSLGRTPLCFASQNGLQYIVTLLIEKRAIVDDLNDSAGEAVSRASSSGHLDLARILIENGAPVESSLLPDLLFRAIRQGSQTLVETLCRRRANVNAKNEKDRTPLHEATIRNRLEMVKILLDHRADVEAGGYRMAARHFTSQQHTAPRT